MLAAELLGVALRPTRTAARNNAAHRNRAQQRGAQCHRAGRLVRCGFSDVSAFIASGKRPRSK
ncbi:hypothetical protein GCM10023107_58900 [Actinoplanes octamycinicus]|nr:hypothetical protein Aoc01nite_89970 [Actinoplanes octamycinicus]